MKIGIMQPYFLPYIGYWQLIKQVDKFVLLDDVNFIKRGYINRNNILMDNQKKLFTIPVKNASQNRLINQTEFDFNNKEKNAFKKMIQCSYGKALCYDDVVKIIEEIVDFADCDVTGFIENSIYKILDYLEINKEIIRSSNINKDNDKKAQDRIIEICHKCSADIYINPSGGRSLYETETFRENGIQLFFLDVDYTNLSYKQFDGKFVQNLSIIDVLMFNKKKDVNYLLDKCNLSIM